MRIRRLVRPAVAGLLFFGGVAMAGGVAKAPPLAAIAEVQPGQWQLREIGAGTSTRSLCVNDAAMLLQLRHGGAQCSRFVIADEPHVATINYSCPGAGHGRTTIRVETRNIFRLDTQGIADGAPFDFVYEGRRTGDCAAAAR